MNVLAFDTSSPVLSIALKKGADKLSETKIVGFLQHAENLLPMIVKLLKSKKLTPEKIDCFLLGRGPGSFTGLRIGYSTIKGFMAVKNKPCYGAFSLDMIAENAPLPEKSKLAVCLDAHRQRVYMRFYEKTLKGWLTKGKPAVLTIPELVNKLPAEIYITGDALIRYADEIRKTGENKKIHFLPDSTWYPRAAVLIDWFETKNPKLEKLETPRDFIPLYFRLSEPEERRKEAKHVLHC